MSRLAFLLFIVTALSHSIKTINYRPVVLMHGIVAAASDLKEHLEQEFHHKLIFFEKFLQ